MPSEPTIICPNCSTEIKLTESLAAPLIQATRTEYENKLAKQETEVSAREEAMRKQQKELAEAQKTIEAQVEKKLKEQRVAIVEEEARKAKIAAASDLEEKTAKLGELEELLKQRTRKLEEAQKAQAEVLRKERALDDEKRELDLTIEKRVQESIQNARDSAKKEAEESMKLKVSEKETQIASMQRQIEELKRKAEQGSQQLQGEALELELEEILNQKFPIDSIDPVPKGEHGGDVLHSVLGPLGQACGLILWESKRTKNWSNSWLSKLRDDQRAAKADIAIIISETLPKEIESFDLIDGVWVSSPKYIIPLAIVIRQSLVEISSARKSQEGQQSKMEMVYEYLTGPRFRQRVEAIVEKFTDMQADLNREKKSMTRLWAKREAQIQGVIESTVGMYGDLQGIAGRALQEIEGLEIPLLESE